MSLALLVGWLVVIWVALWGSVTVTNVLGGLAAAAVLLAVFPVGTHAAPAYAVRPVAAARFVAHFTTKLLEANLILAWEIVTPRNRINEGIVAVPMASCSDGIVTLAANAIGLTPGTITIEVDAEPTVLYVHVLHLHDLEQTRRDLLHLAALIIRAFGSPAAVAALDGASPPTGADRRAAR
ncbi:hypothetical protein BH24ACT3_BH24ACT3_07440 [soil metagenome]